MQRQNANMSKASGCKDICETFGGSGQRAPIVPNKTQSAAAAAGGNQDLPARRPAVWLDGVACGLPFARSPVGVRDNDGSLAKEMREDVRQKFDRIRLADKTGLLMPRPGFGQHRIQADTKPDRIGCWKPVR